MRLFVALCLAVPLSAVPPSAAMLPAQVQQDPEELLRAKLASPFLQLADWTTDYDAARRLAGERDQLVFGYFTTAGY